MDLAKPCLDVGLYTNRIDDVRGFYEREVGLPYEELLKAGGGVHQHRLGLRGSVLKCNADRNVLEPASSSFTAVMLADEEVDEPASCLDPDGSQVILVPPGFGGVTHVGVCWATTDKARLTRLLVEGFDAIQEADGLRVGTTLLALLEDAEAGTDGPMRSLGLRYLTVQVLDVHAEHERLVGLGWTGAVAPMRLGDVAAISFVRDPDGAWVEISQRASLVGELPGD